jgi:hypothetical protein
MIINFILFSGSIVLSGLAILPNILYPKYIKKDEHMLKIGLSINTFLFTSSIYGLFTGNFNIFLCCSIIEYLYLSSFKIYRMLNF